MSTRSRITVTVYNNNNYVVKKKTIPIKGIFRYQLLASAKILSLLSAMRELYGKHIAYAVIELINIDDAKIFTSIITNFSPIPIKIVKKREVIENVV